MIASYLSSPITTPEYILLAGVLVALILSGRAVRW
jgi:hypothetical protein